MNICTDVCMDIYVRICMEMIFVNFYLVIRSERAISKKRNCSNGELPGHWDIFTYIHMYILHTYLYRYITCEGMQMCDTNNL